MPSQPWGAALRPILSLSLAFLLGLPLGIAPAAGQAQPAPAKLSILIIEGEGVINNIQQPTAREPIVKVEDGDHRPIAGAAVLFTLPDSGPSGVFEGGGRSLAVKADRAGRAVAKGFKVNNVQGKFQIQVQASYQGVIANTTITQINTALTAGAGHHRMSGKMIAIIAAVGGAAVVAIAHGARNGSGGRTTTISADTSTVGAPQ